MKMRQIEIYLSVCETLSVTKTANLLYVSQPAISKTIKELEATVGVQLFTRLDNRLVLNEAGKAFRLKAKQLLADFQALANFSGQYAQETPLRVGTSLTIGMHTLPQALQHFQESYPKTPVKVYAENAQQIEQRLLNGELDMAFTEGFISNQRFDKTELSTYPLFVVCAPNSIFVEKKVVTAAEFLDIPFLLRESGSTLRDRFDELTHKLGIEVTPIMESVNTEVLIQATKANLGVTVLAEPLARPYLAAGTLSKVALPNFKMETKNFVVTLRGKVIDERDAKMIACFQRIEQLEQ
jgi:DNA-binding transcriptional LysR family regulator